MTSHEPAAPLRILEIGGDTLFAPAVPSQTTFYWTAAKPRNQGRRALGPIRLARALLDLRAGRFDLLVIHASQYAPWHPRSVLTALRDWHVRAPLGLFAMFAWRLVPLFHRVPIAVVDLGDGFGIGRHNFFLLKACRAFFKRELPSDHWQVFFKSGHRDFPGHRWRSKPTPQGWIAKLRPISYGTFVPLLPLPDDAVAEKTADIFFAGDIEANSTARASGLAELRALQREGYVVDVPAGRLPLNEFLGRMAAAWLAWSPAGFGWDCGRHYEAALVNTVPLTNYPTIMRHRPLLDGEHCVLYGVEPGGLMLAAKAALSDKPRLRRIAANAAAHVRRHHTWQARAEHVAVTVLGRRLDGSRAAPPGAADDPS